MSMLTEEEDASSLGSASEDSSASSASLQRLRTRLDELRETRYIQTRSNRSAALSEIPLVSRMTSSRHTFASREEVSEPFML